MKRILIAVVLAIQSLFLIAQSPESTYPATGNPYPSYVFGVTGGADTITYQRKPLVFTWTMGEIAVAEQRSEDLIVSEGLHQTWPDLFVIPSKDVPDISMVITPNGDGQNDFFVPVADIQARFPNNEIFIFNRWGVLIFQARPYANNWDGTNFQGQSLPQGTYYYLLRLTNDYNTQMQGSITIRR